MRDFEKMMRQGMAVADTSYEEVLSGQEPKHIFVIREWRVPSGHEYVIVRREHFEMFVEKTFK